MMYVLRRRALLFLAENQCNVWTTVTVLIEDNANLQYETRIRAVQSIWSLSKILINIGDCAD